MIEHTSCREHEDIRRRIGELVEMFETLEESGKVSTKRILNQMGASQSINKGANLVEDVLFILIFSIHCILYLQFIIPNYMYNSHVSKLRKSKILASAFLLSYPKVLSKSFTSFQEA